MEKEPKQPKYFFDYNGERVYFTKKNSIIYLHELESHIDHIFVFLSDDPDEESPGAYIWRACNENFDKMVDDLASEGVAVRDTEKFASEYDRCSYYEQGLKAPELPPLEELSPRKEAHARFLEYLIENDLLTDEEFRGDGELFI